MPSVHPVHHARTLEINLGNRNVKVLPRDQPANRLAGLRLRYNNSDPLRHREITPRRLSSGNGRCNRLAAACISRVIFFRKGPPGDRGGSMEQGLITVISLSPRANHRRIFGSLNHSCGTSFDIADFLFGSAEPRWISRIRVSNFEFTSSNETFITVPGYYVNGWVNHFMTKFSSYLMVK